MPYNKVPKNETEYIFKELEALRKEIVELKKRASPTVPIYDFTDFPADAVEGQVAIMENAPTLTGGGGGGGIQFNSGTYGPSNSGDWLHITTDDAMPGGSGDGVRFDLTNSGIFEVVADGSIELTGNGIDIVSPSGGGPIQIMSHDTLLLETLGTADLNINSTAGGDINILNTGSGGTIVIDNIAGTVQIAASQAITLDCATVLNVRNSNSGTGGAVMTFGVENTEKINFYSHISSPVDILSLAYDGTSSKVFLFNLPTSNPGVTGQLWNSSGVLHIA